MSIVLKDGTLAPDIPEGVLESYPNAVISKCTSTMPSITSVVYVLAASDVPYVGIPAEMGELPADMIASLGSKNIHYGYSQGGTEWGDMSQNEGPDAIYNGYIDTVNQTWEVQWSNHDIFTAVAFDGVAFEVTVGTEIYFPNSVPKFILPDGTELPALPEGCFEKYPYGMISYVEITDGEAAYALSVAEGTYIFAPGSETGEGSDYVISLLPGYRHYRYVVAPTAASGWEQYAESTTQHSGHDFSREDGTIEIRWCNHDILTATAMNDDGTPEIGPDLYRKSDVNYRVYGGWLNSMGNQARRLGNVSGALKPGEMETVFSGATLEPLTVTPTSEEQTFTPESPCIGFSVVTVEAAPDTGGGDIVEPEEPVELPRAEDLTFDLSTQRINALTSYTVYGDRSTPQNRTFGSKFKPLQDFVCVGLRYLLPSTASDEIVLEVWDASTETVIVSAVKPATEAVDSWVTIPIEPIQMYKDKEYIFTTYQVTVTSGLNAGKFMSSPTSDYVSYYARVWSNGHVFPTTNVTGTAYYSPVAFDLVIGNSLDLGQDYSEEYSVEYSTLWMIAEQVKRITGVTTINTTSEIISLLQTVPAMTT